MRFVTYCYNFPLDFLVKPLLHTVTFSYNLRVKKNVDLYGKTAVYYSMNSDVILAILFNPISCVLWFFLFSFAYSWWDGRKRRNN